MNLFNELESIYRPHGLVIANLLKEAESQDYSACTFTINSLRIKFRAAKVTPKKIGAFVTFWKRAGAGPIEPYDLFDPFDLLVVSVQTSAHHGQFIFPKMVLLEKGILSQHKKGGKRAIRVYPPWDTANNRQAKITQSWQLKYFLDLSDLASVDSDEVTKLYT